MLKTKLPHYCNNGEAHYKASMMLAFGVKCLRGLASPELVHPGFSVVRSFCFSTGKDDGLVIDSVRPGSGPWLSL